MPSMEIGAQIKAARGDRKQAEVARAAGLTPAALCRIEKGQVVPRWATVERLAAALGVSFEASASAPLDTR